MRKLNFLKLHNGRNQLKSFINRYKQATVGICDAPKPAFYEFEAKQKWQAWKDLGCMDKEEAMRSYVTQLEEIDPEYIIIVEDSISKYSQLPKSISTMAKNEDDSVIKSEPHFEWCKDGVVSKFTSWLESNKDLINKPDESGLSLLHWACDRGREDIAKLLIKYGANVNIMDSEGEMPIHYALLNENEEILKILLKSGADSSKPNLDGDIPASNQLIKDIQKNL